MVKLANLLFMLSMLCWVYEQHAPPTPLQAAGIVMAVAGCGLVLFVHAFEKP